MNYFVAKHGNDHNAGTEEAPFLTINHAAQIAGPGDVVTVDEGIYREWVSPANGGTEDARIIYQAKEGADVTISGAEVIKGWELEGHIWKVVIKNDFFGAYNPYKEIIWGDWFFDHDKEFHTGEVYLNGKAMYESLTLEGVEEPKETENSHEKEASLLTWHCHVDDQNTTIWANFGEGVNPNEEHVEINVRPFVFWPERTGRNYITVKGFKLKQAATNWSPPTALQTGLIGPHWSKGWVIENNEISDSKCVGISLGKEISTGHNEWTTKKTKGGTQREKEVIFRSLHMAGWTKENIGHHVVRNNVIRDCNQAGIVGHLGSAFCLIEGNHIYRIHQRKQWHGAEVGGIKFHAAIDTIIRNNLIHDTYRGIWLDWQAQGTRVTGNVLYGHTAEDFMAEVCLGPYLVDHNIFLSEWAIKDLSTGGAFAHNLFTGKIAATVDHGRFTPYHFPHSTAVHGVANILGGDMRYYNNLFIREDDAEVSGLSNFWNGAVLMDGVPSNATFMQTPVGLSQYDDYPCGLTDEKEADISEQRTYQEKLLVYIDHNHYTGGALPYKTEQNATQGAKPQVEFLDRDEGTLKITFPEGLPEVPVVTSAVLGEAYQPEMRYENPDGTDIRLENDFFGTKRDALNAGPFQVNEAKELVIRFKK